MSLENVALIVFFTLFALNSLTIVAIPALVMGIVAAVVAIALAVGR